MKIYNAEIYTMGGDGVIENGWIELCDGKISALGSGTPAALSDGDIDAQGGTLLPGFFRSSSYNQCAAGSLHPK